MRLPRDLSGEDLAALLRRRYGYRLVRQRGSPNAHCRLAIDDWPLTPGYRRPYERRGGAGQGLDPG